MLYKLFIYIYDLYCLKAICYDLTWTSMDGNNPALRSHVSHFQGQQLWTAPVDPEPAEKSLILQNFFLSLGQGFKSHPQCLEISAKDLVSLTTLTFDILWLFFGTPWNHCPPDRFYEVQRCMWVKLIGFPMTKKNVHRTFFCNSV